MDRYWQLKGGHGLYFRTSLRTGQFLFAIIAAGLYGADLAIFTRHHLPAQSTWIFAEVLVAFSVVTGAIHCIFTVTNLLWCSWDAALALMWLVVSIITGQMALEHPDKELAPGIAVKDTHAKVSFAFGLINTVLWIGTVAEACLLCCSARTIRRKKDNIEV